MIGIPSLYETTEVTIHGIRVPLNSFRYELSRDNNQAYPQCHLVMDFSLTHDLKDRIDATMAKRYAPAPEEQARNIALSL